MLVEGRGDGSGTGRGGYVSSRGIAERGGVGEGKGRGSACF